MNISLFSQLKLIQKVNFLAVYINIKHFTCTNVLVTSDFNYRCDIITTYLCVPKKMLLGLSLNLFRYVAVINWRTNNSAISVQV